MVLVPCQLLLNFILILKIRFLLPLSKWNIEELHFCLGKIVSATLRTSQCSRLGWDSRLWTNFKPHSLNYQRSLNPNSSSWEATKLAENFMIAFSPMINFKVFTAHSWIELHRTRKNFNPHLNNYSNSNSNTFHKKHSWVKFSLICLKNGKQECNHSHRKRLETILHLKSSISSLTVNFLNQRKFISVHKISNNERISSIH